MIVSGPASSVPRTVTVGSAGTYFNYLDAAWPPGQYTVTATWSGGTASATGVHSLAPSVGTIWFDVGVATPLNLPEWSFPVTSAR